VLNRNAINAAMDCLEKALGEYSRRNIDCSIKNS